MVCPPGNPLLVPVSDPTTIISYDDVLPAGVSNFTIRVWLQNADSIAAFTMPMAVKVDGVAPTVQSVTLAPALNALDVREADVVGSSVLLGGIAYVPTLSVAPGYHQTLSRCLQTGAARSSKVQHEGNKVQEDLFALPSCIFFSS